MLVLARTRAAAALMAAAIAASAGALTLATPSSAGGGAITEVPVAGAAGVPKNAGAVALQVTITNPQRAGFATAFPCGTQRPASSNINFPPGETRSNLVVVPVGAGGKVCVYTHAPADVVVDVYGSFPSTAGWRSISPHRVSDTRSTGQVGAGQIIRVPVAGKGGVGASASAAALSLTAVNARTPGFLTAFPCGEPVPATSNLNFGVGAATANLALVRLGRGEVCIYSKSATDVVVDVTGWTDRSDVFSAGTSDRVFDSRTSGTRRGAGSVSRVHVGTGQGAAVLNVTSTQAVRNGFLAVYPCSGAVPKTSNVNFQAPQSRSNLVLMTPDAAGDVCVFASADTHLVVDRFGWLTQGSGYGAVSPSRLLDTRGAGSGSRSGPGAGSGPMANVVANVNRAQWLQDGGRIPASTEWEPSGSFRTFCAYSHLAYDDPIIFPGKRGAAHLHMFFGNVRADAMSTYQSLRTTGDSTCQGGDLNRTGYWIPTVHNAAGQVVVPDYFELYYKGNGTKEMIRRIATNPNGLRMIAGYDMAGKTEMTARWNCGTNDRMTTTIPNCGSGDKVRVNLRFPMCWNGRDLDSPNHRSHMAYGLGGDGWVTKERGCPTSHPVHLPELTLIAVFPSDGNSSNWYLSSDRMPGMSHPNGSTFHADWFGAWDNQTQETWTQKCIREMRTCVFGELGDGTQMKNNPAYTGPKLLNTPSR
jgi:hypothetical protein